MTLLMNEDFENWNVNNWSIISDGSQIVYAGVGRNDSKGLYIENSKGDPVGHRLFIYKTLESSAENDVTVIVWVRFHLLSLEAQNGGKHYEFIVVYDTDYTDTFEVNIVNIDGTLYFGYIGQLGYGDLTDYGAIEYGKWYSFRINFRRAVEGFEKLWINDELVVNNTGNTTMVSAVQTYYFGFIEFPYSNNTYWFDMDDITIYDEYIPYTPPDPTLVGTIIIRPYCITLGNGTSSYDWYGIRSIKWSDVTPWVHIDIPSGPMLHQHIRSPHVTGEIVAIDLDKLYTALFSTAVNGSNSAIDINDNNKKYPVTYCRFKFINQDNEIVEYSVSKLRIETIGVENIELGTEARWLIRFSADLIKKES